MPRICHIELAPVTAMPRVLRQCAAAKKAGFEVDIIGEGPSQSFSDFQFHGFPHTSSRFSRFFIHSRKMVEKAIELNADIIQVHSPALLLYLMKAKRLGKKVIFDSHEYYPVQIRQKQYIPAFLRRPVSSLYRMFETWICRRIDCVLYPSTINGKNIFENRAKRSLKLENYPMLSGTPTIPFDEKERRIIYAGSLTPDRGISELAAAVETLSDVTLVLCGPFSSDRYQSELLEARRPWLEYKGSLDRESLYMEYGKCMVGMCTLHPVGQYVAADNLATKICEYMQCGLPVIMSNFRSNQAYNDRFHFGLCVDPESPEEIADAITYLLDHPEEARQMGENGRKAVKEEFNWGVEEQKLFALYEEILNPSRSR